MAQARAECVLPGWITPSCAPERDPRARSDIPTLQAQHKDFSVFGDRVHPMDPGQLDNASDKSVEEAERHGMGAHRARRAWSSPVIE